MDQVAQSLNEMLCIQKAMMFIDQPSFACNAIQNNINANNPAIESHVVGHQFAIIFWANDCHIVHHKL